MSSMPFQLGLPIVDSLPLQSGNYVLRSKNRDEFTMEISRIRKLLTKKDLVKVYHIGSRPDYPIPVCRYFTEVSIEIGAAEEWINCLPVICLYNSVFTGMAEKKA